MNETDWLMRLRQQGMLTREELERNLGFSTGSHVSAAAGTISHQRIEPDEEVMDIPAEELGSRTFTDHATRQYVVRDHDFNEILRVGFEEVSLSGMAPLQYISEKLKLVRTTCANCQTPLVENEYELCGECEAGAVIDLLRVRDDLA